MGGVTIPSHDYKKLIIELLNKGELLSSNITDELSAKFGITKNYGRKIILKHVRKGDIFSSYPLVFKNNEAGYSLSPGNNQYTHLLQYKPRLKIVFEIFVRNGFISKYHLLKLGGVIDTEGSRYYDLGKIVSDLGYFFPHLKEKTINEEIFYHNDIDEVTLQRVYEEELQKRKFEVQFIPVVLNYANQINLIYRKPHYINKEHPFTGVSVRQNLMFDATAYTGIGNPNKEKSVVVFDFKINDTYKAHDFQGFKYRVDTLINSTRHLKQRIIPVIVVSECDRALIKEVYDNNRFLIFTLSNIFGSKFKSFLELIEIKDIHGLKNAQEILRIVENTGYANQLTRFFPYVFESLISEILNKVFNEYYRQYKMTRGKIIKNEGQMKEYDIWFENEKEILVVECKHYRSLINWEKRNSKGKLESNCAKYFFENKYQFLVDKGYSKDIKFLFVASSGFTQGVYSNVSKLDRRLSHDIFDLTMTASNLIDFCKDNNIGIKEQKDWLNKYYIRERPDRSKEDHFDGDVDFDEEIINIDSVL